MRIGLVISWTRCLFGLDYDSRLIGLYIGPVAFCVAWGPPENNPFVSQEELNDIVDRRK